MSKKQVTVLLAMVLLFCLIYFLGDTKSKDQQLVEKSRSENIESTGIQNLLIEAKSNLDDTQKGILNALTSEVDKSQDSLKVPVLEKLSSTWYSYGYPAIAGHYAEEIANTLNTEDSWAIAGSTFGICLRTSEEQKIRDYCLKRSVQAFENAISLNPDKVDYRTNLALNFVESPPQENPMKGILMLRELNEKYPNDIGVLKQLGRLAIMTGQYDKAKERLTRAYNIAPENVELNCFLAQALESLGNMEEAKKHKEICK